MGEVKAQEVGRPTVRSPSSPSKEEGRATREKVDSIKKSLQYADKLVDARQEATERSLQRQRNH